MSADTAPSVPVCIYCQSENVLPQRPNAKRFVCQSCGKIFVG